MATLHDAILALVAKGQRRASGGDQLYQPGTVTAVNGDGTYAVSVGGVVVVANTETDFPFAPGQRVYVSEVKNGKPVVNGPRY